MEKTADLIMFMGQSNMAGRGITSDRWPRTAPEVIPGAGYEFRAVSDPRSLHKIEEPFGVNENSEAGINDGTMKTGSMVSAFVNAYYINNGNICAVCVSASKGGSRIAQWQPGGLYLNDSIDRLKKADEFLHKEGYAVRHRFMLWCQGETDGDLDTPEGEFKAGFRAMLRAMKEAGIEKLFMVLPGKCNIPGSEDRYDSIRRWERELACWEDDVFIVSEDFETMLEEGLMKDEFHYFQEGYNRCGETAGRRAAELATEKA